MVRLTEEKLEHGTAEKLIGAPDGSGSILVHYAVVKPMAENRRTRGIRFVAGSETEAEMKALEEKLRSAWEVDDVVLLRRVGELGVGEVISVVAVAASGREAAFGACRDAVSGYKKMQSLQKEEIFES